MSTGIVIYSYTGHTQTVIKQLADQMVNKPAVFTLEPAGQINLSDLKTPIKSIPDITAYDTIILATPVHGGRMSSPMATFLDETQDLKNKQVILLATHFFPHKWGCAQMFQALEEECAQIGAEVIHTDDMCWPGLVRKTRLSKLVNRTIGFVE
jgi:menaquinone-dependent protoporphyrinogen IX oxidase